MDACTSVWIHMFFRNMNQVYSRRSRYVVWNNFDVLRHKFFSLTVPSKKHENHNLYICARFTWKLDFLCGCLKV